MANQEESHYEEVCGGIEENPITLIGAENEGHDVQENGGHQED